MACERHAGGTRASPKRHLSGARPAPVWSCEGRAGGLQAKTDRPRLATHSCPHTTGRLRLAAYYCPPAWHWLAAYYSLPTAGPLLLAAHSRAPATGRPPLAACYCRLRLAAYYRPPPTGRLLPAAYSGWALATGRLPSAAYHRRPYSWPPYYLVGVGGPARAPTTSRNPTPSR